jgi:secreted trypsin-like serine protease
MPERPFNCLEFGRSSIKFKSRARTLSSARLGRILRGMLKYVALLSLSISILACGRAGNQNPVATSGVATRGIVGGNLAAAGQGNMKSVVAIMNLTTDDLCSGSLLEGNIVLTAAHCIENNLKSVNVFFGSSVDEGSVMRKVDIALVHANYHDWAETDENDIALVHFTGAVPPGFVPATLLRDSTLLKNAASVLLAGYGVTDPKNGRGDGLLRMVTVTIKDAAFGKGEVSVDQTHGKGSCSGDSGGPAYLLVGNQPLLWGITSRGDSTERGRDLCNHDGIYTNAAAYLDWIAKNSAALQVNGSGSLTARAVR